MVNNKSWLYDFSGNTEHILTTLCLECSNPYSTYYYYNRQTGRQTVREKGGGGGGGYKRKVGKGSQLRDYRTFLNANALSMTGRHQDGETETMHLVYRLFFTYPSPLSCYGNQNCCTDPIPPFLLTKLLLISPFHPLPAPSLLVNETAFSCHSNLSLKFYVPSTVQGHLGTNHTFTTIL